MPPQRRKSIITDQTRFNIRYAARELRASDTSTNNAAKFAARALRDRVIREAFLNGVGTKDMVDLFAEAGFPVSRSHIDRTIRGLNRAPIFDVTDAIRRYQDGASLRDLGKAYGCAPKVVQRALQDAGVEIRGREEAKRIALAAKAEA